MPQEISVRKFKPGDRESVRDITYNNAFLGEPAGAFFEGQEIVSDALTLYFTDYEPQSSFVAEADKEVVGCLIGAKDKIASEKIIQNKIMPALFWRVFVSGALFRKKNFIFLLQCLLSAAKGEFSMPQVAKVYPATLHINIKKEFHGLDIGSRLIAAYLDYLKEEGVCGVHLATMSEGAAQFFSKQGFQLWYKGRRSYFRHILRRAVPLYIYAKKL